jgi:hypothetical protein
MDGLVVVVQIIPAVLILMIAFLLARSLMAR